MATLSYGLLGIPPGDTRPALLILVVLAFLANVCYCAAYIPLQPTFVTWRKYRWALLLTGTLFAILIENYWIAEEIYPFVAK